MIQKMLSFLFATALMVSAVEADSTDFFNNTKTFIHFHPVTLIASTGTDELPTLLYATIEKPLSPGRSLIIYPDIWWWDYDDTDSEESLDIFRIGTGIGLRHYPSHLNKGFYLQAMPSIHYLKGTYKDYGSYDETKDEISALMLDCIFYIGYSYKWDNISFMFDLGIGYLFTAGKGTSSDSDDIEQVSGSGKQIWYDANLAIGFGF